jgi:hypothetical protein
MPFAYLKTEPPETPPYFSGSVYAKIGAHLITKGNPPQPNIVHLKYRHSFVGAS